jgi:hypothetical protein
MRFCNLKNAENWHNMRSRFKFVQEQRADYTPPTPVLAHSACNCTAGGLKELGHAHERGGGGGGGGSGNSQR